MTADREKLVLAIAQAALYPSVYMEGCPATYRRTAERIAEAVLDELKDVDPSKVFWQDWAAKRLEISRSQWLKAAKRALAGDMRDLRLRVELAEAPPVAIVASSKEPPHDHG